MDTREKILDAALSQFALKGYAGASMRAIARSAGIRESSIYHHFENKRALLADLIARSREAARLRKAAFGNALDHAASVTREAFIRVGLSYLREYLLGDVILPLAGVLEAEMTRDAEAATLYRDMLFDEAEAYQTAVFETLIARGEVKGEAKTLAAAYQADMLYAFSLARTGAGERAQDTLATLLGAFYDQHFERRDGE